MLNSNMTESIFSSIFGRGGFQRNLFSFENKSNLKILLHQILLKHHYIIDFFLASVE